VYPNLEAEQVRRGHTDDYVAQMLGMTKEEYIARKEAKSVKLAQAVRLATMYKMPTEYLFWSGA
jgi:hypothetical protein